MSWTVQALLKEATAKLQASGIDSPRLDAELLLAFELQCERVAFFSHPDRVVDSGQVQRFHGLVERRAERFPLQYLTGSQEFYGRPFFVSSAVLIPRPETELLVETCLAFLKQVQGEPRILDIGTGSGCIAATLACEAPQARVTAVDISPAALEVAERNCRALQCASRVELLLGDTLNPVLSRGRSFELITSNPPYVGETERASVSPEVARYEPPEAVFSGEAGMEVFEDIFRLAPLCLVAGGRLVVEVGYGQADRVVDAGRGNGWILLEKKRDLAGIERCIVFEHP